MSGFQTSQIVLERDTSELTAPEYDMIQISRQTVHDTLISKALNFLLANKYTNIRADLSGWAKPETISWSNGAGSHIPDLTAENASIGLVFEMETQETIFDDHTASQWALFSAFALQHGKEFWVVVPKGCRKNAEYQISNLKVTAKVWEL